MSAWRREAAARLPEVWKDHDARETAHDFFFELLPFVREAHRAGDEDALRRAYDYALWCLRQGGYLANAVAVSFYEHLFDSVDVHQDVLKWLHPQVIDECWPLWEYRLDEKQLRTLHGFIGRKR